MEASEFHPHSRTRKWTSLSFPRYYIYTHTAYIRFRSLVPGPCRRWAGETSGESQLVSLACWPRVCWESSRPASLASIAGAPFQRRILVINQPGYLISRTEEMRGQKCLKSEDIKRVAINVGLVVGLDQRLAFLMKGAGKAATRKSRRKGGQALENWGLLNHVNVNTLLIKKKCQYSIEYANCQRRTRSPGSTFRVSLDEKITELAKHSSKPFARN